MIKSIAWLILIAAVVSGCGAPVSPPPPTLIMSAYPTEVSSVITPDVYSYGGPEGRANMDGFTRGLFDRYIGELSREGKISGSSPDTLYSSFDSKYDFRLYQTDAGATWLIHSKSGDTFLVPKDASGQIFRDLKLPYDYVFQNGQQVDVGTDNFDFQAFQADRVGFVGAWPVLVKVDSGSIPQSWINMDLGGKETSIQVASNVATATVEATSIPSFTVDSLNLSPDLTAALKKHSGLEASITAEAGGKFSAQVTVWGTEGNAQTAPTEVTPSTLTENTAPKDRYDNTPVMQTADGKKVYWIQEYGAWFEVPISSDITKPVYTEFAKPEVVTRILRAEFPEAFSQAALDRWTKTPGLSMTFYYSGGTANDEVAYIRSRSATDKDINYSKEAGIQLLPAYFYTAIDGQNYEYASFKVLEPTDPKVPKGDEWQIMKGVIGPELIDPSLGGVTKDIRPDLARWMTGEGNRQVVFVIASNGDFFNNYGILNTIPVHQPLLNKLLGSLPGVDFKVAKGFGELGFPGSNSLTYKDVLKAGFGWINKDSVGAELASDGTDQNGNPTFAPFPEDSQNVLYPLLVFPRN